jgi:hypothetical protein
MKMKAVKKAKEREVEKSVNKKFIDASEECLPKHRARSSVFFFHSFPKKKFSIVANKP